MMRAAVFDKPGIENLNVMDNVEKPKLANPDNVLIKVKVAGLNPIDNVVVSGSIPTVRPIPHIPGAEVSGIVDEIGSEVSRLKKGDRVVIHNKVFDGICDMCLSGLDMICRNGGLISVITNGGFAEYIAVPQRNVFKIPDDMDWDLAASLPVTVLTPFHALNEARMKINEFLLVFGATGNTGMIATQLGKRMGARVIAVSKEEWVRDFGADYIIHEYDRLVEQVREITSGKMADVVLNSLGVKTWDSSFESTGINGRLVSFGGLTGADVKLNIQSLYSRQIKLIGSTGGTRKELRDLIDNHDKLQLKKWKRFDLDNVQEALHALFSKERSGRIFLDIL
ncbi:MAG TPA: alcohol dehydrogenase catalytic domain-containing protein [Nitrososphaeraceae archaeon]|nr:alcohol dehydrogenase catalytic domain-containing protein [Nitrososphaeraceae archaeon]